MDERTVNFTGKTRPGHCHQRPDSGPYAARFTEGDGHYSGCTTDERGTSIHWHGLLRPTRRTACPTSTAPTSDQTPTFTFRDSGGTWYRSTQTAGWMCEPW
jgi:FtsP/CotA-like multicopper oxidase with cupredoxin domain